MAVNFAQYQVDPFEGMNQGMARLGNAMQFRQQSDRQARLDTRQAGLDELNMATQRQQQTLANLGIEKATGERDALQAVYGGGDYKTAIATKAQHEQAIAEQTRARAEQQFWFTEKMKFLEPLYKGMIDNGDSEGLTKLIGAYENDPHLGQVVKQLKSQNFTVTGKGETEVTRPFTQEELLALTKSAKDDVVAGAIANGQPGNYQVKMKGGKVVSFAPAKPIGTPTKVYDESGKLLREAYPKADGTFDLKPGETTKQPDLLTPQEEAQKKRIRAAGKTDVTVNTGTKSMEKLGEEMSKVLVAERKDVQGAVSGLNNLKEAEKLVNSGVITGTGAEYLINMGNFLSSRLGINLGKTPVENTQAYTATMGNQVGQIIKQFGSGTGLSDADREYAEKIVGGKITLTEGAIKKLMGINKRAFENVIKNYNQRADQAMKRPGAESLPYDLRVEYDFSDQAAGAKGKTLDATTAQSFLKAAGGNKDKARELAKQAGYSF